MAAIVFQTVAGICAALLTFGRPFMKTDRVAHKAWHSVIGITGIICILIAGVLNFRSQSDSTKAFDRLSAKIDASSSAKTPSDLVTKTIDVLDMQNKRIVALEAQGRYPEITVQNAAPLVTALLPLGRHKLEISGVDQDTLKFAQSIADALRLAGWDAPEFASQAMAVTFPSNVTFCFKHSGAPPQTAQIFFIALTSEYQS